MKFSEMTLFSLIFSSSEAGWLERKAENMVVQTEHKNFMICKMQQATEVCKTTLSKRLLDLSTQKLNAQVNQALPKHLREFKQPADGRNAPWTLRDVLYLFRQPKALRDTITFSLH